MLVILFQAKFVWGKTEKGGASKKKKIKVFSEKEVRKSMLSWFFELNKREGAGSMEGPGF